MRIIDRLHEIYSNFFNKEKEVYKELIGDDTRSENIDISIPAGTDEYEASDFVNLIDIQGTNITLLPMQTENSEVNIFIGNYHWKCIDIPKENVFFEGQGVGTTAGAVRLTPNGNWNDFANVVNGLYTITFPPLGVGTMTVGTTGVVFPNGTPSVSQLNNVSFYYNFFAFITAFLNTSEDMIVVTDGSVYRGSISNENLVVSGAGEIGAAGGANFVAKINQENTGVFSNFLAYVRNLKDYLVKQLVLNTASDSWLDLMGREYYDIDRLLGETDTTYIERIQSLVLSPKESPINIEITIRPYCQDVYVDDDISSGAFSDVSFSDFLYDIDSPQITRGCRTGESPGLVYHFQVFILRPFPGFENYINTLILNTKVAGVTYDVFVFEDQDDFDNVVPQP
jgi:hypothetical protein